MTYREYVTADLKVLDEITPFPGVIKLAPGETLVYAAVEFESESHRNDVNETHLQRPGDERNYAERTGL